MYIYIEGKEPVARKSKSLAEMGVKDGDNLIVTTEMKLPFDEYSDDEDLDGGQGMFPNIPGMEEFEELSGGGKRSGMQSPPNFEPEMHMHHPNPHMNPIMP